MCFIKFPVNMSHVNALYHIVFSTYERQMTITNDYREDVYRFMWNIIKEHNCKLLRIGGIPNHIHILINLNSTVALSDLVRDLKAKSSGWIHRDARFPLFNGWAKEYFAATISYKGRYGVIEYIKNQQEHHNIRKFEDEILKMMDAEGMTTYDNDTL